LKDHGWNNIDASIVAAGDAVIWDTPGKLHFGLVVEIGGQLWVVQNSSADRRPVKIPMHEYPYPIKEVLRKNTAMI
jgi:hypothetical protein